MGQRLQAFINIPNLSKKFYEGKNLEDKSLYENKLPEYMKLMEAREKDRMTYGEEENTVLSWNHQWLYGRSAPLACLNVLEFLDKMDKHSNYNNPFHLDFNYNTISLEDEMKSTITAIEFIMGVFNDNQLSKYTRAGIERFFFLNEEEPEIRQDFTLGDNNDGVFIIDSISKKYCFMNVFSQDKHITSVNALPKLKPCSAIEYIEAYYPSTMTIGAKEKIQWDIENTKMSKEDAEKSLSENGKINKKFAKRFKKYEILTLEEVSKIFPNMKGLKTKKVVKKKNIKSMSTIK